jgi:hypothetical protein
MSETEEKATVTVPGTVEKIIKSPFPSEPEKAQIKVDTDEELYREIRIENSLTGPNGEEVKLKKGAEVQVTIEAAPAATESADATNKKSDI